MGRDSSKPDLETYLLRAFEDEDYDLDGTERPNGVVYIDWTDSAADAFASVQEALPEGSFDFEVLDEDESQFRVACGRREVVAELEGLASDEPGGDGIDAIPYARDVLRPDYDVKVIAFTANSDTIGYVVASSKFFEGFERKHPAVCEELFVELEDLEASWDEALDDDYDDDYEDE